MPPARADSSRENRCPAAQLDQLPVPSGEEPQPCRCRRSPSRAAAEQIAQVTSGAAAANLSASAPARPPKVIRRLPKKSFAAFTKSHSPFTPKVIRRIIRRQKTGHMVTLKSSPYVPFFAQDSWIRSLLTISVIKASGDSVRPFELL